MNPPERERTDWEPFVAGCFAGVAPWVVIFVYLAGNGINGNIPDFVYAILIV